MQVQKQGTVFALELHGRNHVPALNPSMSSESTLAEAWVWISCSLRFLLLIAKVYALTGMPRVLPGLSRSWLPVLLAQSIA